MINDKIIGKKISYVKQTINDQEISNTVITYANEPIDNHHVYILYNNRCDKMVIKRSDTYKL